MSPRPCSGRNASAVNASSSADGFSGCSEEEEHDEDAYSADCVEENSHPLPVGSVCDYENYK